MSDLVFTQEATPALPAAGQNTLFVNTSGALSLQGSSGPPVVLGAGMANPMTATSDLIVGAAGGVPARLAVGTTGYVLAVISGAVAWAQGALLGVANVFTKNQSVAAVSLTSGSSIAVDASGSNNFKLVLGTNATLANPTSLTDGMVLNFRLKQDGTGSRTLSYGSKYKFPGGTAPVLSTAAAAVDFMSCYYDSTDDTLACVLSTAFS